MSDIFREVDEALQREKAAKFWKEYGPTLVLAAILMVLATGATTAYRAWQTSRHQEETSKLVVAAEQKDIAAAMEKAAQDDLSDGHKAVALLNAAAKYADAKNFAKAAELYDSVSQDKDAPPALRDAGTIFYSRAAVLAAGDKQVDYKMLAERVMHVAQNAKSPFQKQAKLEAALLYGNGLGDYTKALELLQGFEEESSADSLKEKAIALKHVYEYEVSTAQKSSAQQ